MLNDYHNTTQDALQQLTQILTKDFVCLVNGAEASDVAIT